MHGIITDYIINPSFWVKEIRKEMRLGRITKEEGNKALFKLLMLACGSKEKR